MLCALSWVFGSPQLRRNSSVYYEKADQKRPAVRASRSWTLAQTLSLYHVSPHYPARQRNRSLSFFRLGDEDTKGSEWGYVSGWAPTVGYTVGAVPSPMRWGWSPAKAAVALGQGSVECWLSRCWGGRCNMSLQAGSSLVPSLWLGSRVLDCKSQVIWRRAGKMPLSEFLSCSQGTPSQHINYLAHSAGEDWQTHKLTHTKGWYPGCWTIHLLYSQCRPWNNFPFPIQLMRMGSYGPRFPLVLS